MESYKVKSGLALAAMTLLFIIGGYFLTGGITGLYLLETNKDYCADDSDCNYGICCLFYHEESGVCSDEGSCSAIYEVTRDYKAQMSSDLFLKKFTQADMADVTKIITSKGYTPQKAKTAYPSIIIGAMILTLALVWLTSKRGRHRGL